MNLFFLEGTFDITPFFPQSGNTFAFDWFTLAYGIILVISIIVGIKRGFLMSLLSLVSGLLAVVVAALLAKPFGTMLFNTSWGSNLTGTIVTWLQGKGEAFTAEVTSATTAEDIATLLPSAGIPAILCGLLSKIIVKFVPTEGTSTFGQIMGEGLAKYTFIIGSFIVILIVLLIVVALLKKFTKKLREVQFAKALDSTLGAVMGLAVGCLVICVVSYGLSFLITVPKCSEWLTTQLYLGSESDNVWTFSKMVYNYNIVGKLFDLYLA